MIKNLRSLAVAFFVLTATICHAQAPNISYATPQTYEAGTAITPLSPVNTGGAVTPESTTTIASGFSSPIALAADAVGNLYVVSNSSSSIVKVSPTGVQTTIGSGFNRPKGIAVDAAGNVYVADFGNNAIKKIPANSGPIVTIGSGINEPYGIAIGQDGMLYISEWGANEILRVSPTDGSSVDYTTGFNTPTGIAVDNTGNVYVADRGSNSIKEIIRNPASVLILGSGNGGPSGVAVDAAGNVYYADTHISTITEILIGSGKKVAVGSGLLSPAGLIITGNNVFYIADSGTGSIKKFVPGDGSYSIDKPLPAGLSFDKSTGTISGTPTAASPAANYTVTATNAAGSGTAVINIEVKPHPKPIISYPSPQVYIVDLPITTIYPVNSGSEVNPWVDDDSVPYAVSPALPQGLVFNGFDGSISGTPTVTAQAQDYTISASNPWGTGTTILNIKVTTSQKPVITYINPQIVLSTNIAIMPISASITVATPDPGGVSISPALPQGLILDSNNGTITGTPQAAQPATIYMVTATNTVGSNSTTISIEVIAPAKPVISYPSPQVYTVGTEIQQINPVNTGGGTPINDPNNKPYSITPALPPGLNFDGFQGSIFGIPTAAAAATNYTVTATNAGGSSTTVINIEVLPYPKTVVTYSSPQVYTAEVTIPPLIPTISGGDIFPGDPDVPPFSISPALPPGLNFDGFSATITGTPATASSATDYTVSVINQGSITSTSVVNIQVNPLTKPIIKYSSPQAYNINTSISSLSPINTGGAVQPGGFSATPALPAGLTINADNGTISGAPIVASPATDYTVTATNPGGSATTNVNIAIIQPPLPTLSYHGPDVFTAGTPAAPLAPTSTGVSTVKNNGSITIASGLDVLRGVAVDNAGNTYAAQLNLGNVKKIFADGSAPRVIASGLRSPAGLASDPSGNIYVTENDGGSITKIPVNGGPTVSIATGLDRPYAITSDAAGNLFFTSMGDGSVQKIPSGGGAPVVVAQGLNSPSGIAVDAAGNIYITERDANLIVKIPAGTNAHQTIGAAFGNPNGVAVDANGNIYFVDLTSSMIGVYYAGATSAVSVGFGLSTPVWLSMDGKNNIYVSDFNTESIKKLAPLGGYFITPALPAGLLLDQGTGIISGTPAVASPATTYSITAYNASGPVTAYVNIKVLPAISLSNLTISNGTLTPKFTSANTVYATAVDNTVTSVTVTPTAASVSATLAVNGVAVTSGTVSQSIPLTGAKTTITSVVTSQDGLTSQPYTIVVSKGLSSNAVLTSLKLNNGIDLPFSPGVARYTASVGANITSVAVTPACVDPDALIKINDVPVQSGSTSAPIALNAGLNVITTTVVAPDGVSLRTYTISITRVASTNSSLVSISLSSGALSPNFSSTTLAYTATVANAVTSLTETPTTADAGSNIKVNGNAVASGIPSTAIPLAVGANVINTVVTAQDGTTTKTYKITVTRAAPSNNAVLLSLVPGTGVTLSPSFSPGIARYTASVSTEVNTVNLTPTAIDANATIKINGVSVLSGSVSAPIPLAVGSNVISTVITAQDGTSIRTYTVTITRAPSPNAALSSLIISAGGLSPVFNTATTSYTAAEPFAVLSVKITPTAANVTAQIQVNGTAVVSGAASADIPLSVGPNTISTVVTSQDGTATKTYTITVNRAAASTNAVLAHLVLNGGIMSPAFSPGVARYTSAVSNAITAISVTPTTIDATATVKVNGISVASGATSQDIVLNVGSNVITTQITAQDGISIRNYTITVTRAAPSSMTLAAELSDNSVTADGITVHQSISPNGDGNNDVLLIDGISAFPDNNLVIFDRSGGLVFNAKGYNNGTVVFDGHSNKNGRLQQPGTYFYSLDYKTGDVKKHKTGYILIKY